MQTLDEQVLMALRQTIRAIDMYSKQMAKKFGLTWPQLIVLKAIHELEAPSLKVIASNVTLSSATVSDILDRLIAKGLVTRSRSGGDKRQTELKITVAGRELLQRAPSLLQKTFVRKFNALELWEQNLLLSSVQRIAMMMNAEDFEEEEGADVMPLFIPSEKDDSQSN